VPGSAIAVFPLTHAFVALVASQLKGGDYEYWFEALKTYRISAYCRCGHCYSFKTECDEGIGAFDTGDAVLFFARTMVVMHHKADGTLAEFEVPTRDDIPYAGEYGYYFEEGYVSGLTAREAKEICEWWFAEALGISGNGD